MSRHFLPTRPDRQAGRRAFSVSCGVAGLDGFFLSVQLQRAGPGEDPVLESLGGGRRHEDVDEVLARAAQWAIIPPTLRQQLLEGLRV